MFDWLQHYLDADKLLRAVGPLPDPWFVSHMEAYIEAVWEELTPSQRAQLWDQHKEASHD